MERQTVGQFWEVNISVHQCLGRVHAGLDVVAMGNRYSSVIEAGPEAL